MFVLCFKSVQCKCEICACLWKIMKNLLNLVTKMLSVVKWFLSAAILLRKMNIINGWSGFSQLTRRIQPKYHSMQRLSRCFFYSFFSLFRHIFQFLSNWMKITLKLGNHKYFVMHDPRRTIAHRKKRHTHTYTNARAQGAYKVNWWQLITRKLE